MTTPKRIKSAKQLQASEAAPASTALAERVSEWLGSRAKAWRLRGSPLPAGLSAQASALDIAKAALRGLQMAGIKPTPAECQRLDALQGNP